MAGRSQAYASSAMRGVLAFFLAWTRANGLSLRSMFACNWRWALRLGALAGALLAVIALGYDSTSPPSGLEFVGAIAWRGLIYGAADGLLLGAFPALAVFTAFPLLRGRAHVCERRPPAPSP